MVRKTAMKKKDGIKRGGEGREREGKSERVVKGGGGMSDDCGVRRREKCERDSKEGGDKK